MMTQPTGRTVLVLGATPEAQRAAQALQGLGYGVIPLQPDDLLGFEGQVGGFRAQVRAEGQPQSLAADAVMVAIGNDRSGGATDLPRSPRALTASQLRRQLEARPITGAALPYRQARYLLLLEPDGQTQKEPAVEMLYLARDLRARWRCEVTVLYHELLVDTMPLERLTRELRQGGVVFTRTGALSVALDDQGVTVTVAEGPLRGDYVVMAEAVRPHADAPALAALLQVRLGVDGYFQDVNIRQVRAGPSNRKGVYFAGRCHLDGDLATALADAEQVAASVDALLRAGPQPEPTRAEVDRSRCIRCLTCVRTCPHAAVEIVADETSTAAQVFALACWGCGACAGNCPVQAITLLGQSAPAWMQTAEVSR